MPTYVYECDRCSFILEVIKSIASIDSEEFCPKRGCDSVRLHRVISPVQINTSVCQFEAHHNYAFGKVVHNKREIKNEIARIKGETGKEIVEVGSDNLKSIKKKHKAYTID